MEPERGVGLHPGTTSTDPRIPWIGWALFLLALVLWFGSTGWPSIWSLPTGLTLLGGGLLLAASWKGVQARKLRARLGEIELELEPHPGSLGHPLSLRCQVPVLAPTVLRTASLRLQRDQARIVTYGIQERERKTWSAAFEREVITLESSTPAEGEILTLDGKVEIPGDQLASSEWTRWWVVLEISLEGCPLYSASIPVEIL